MSKPQIRYADRAEVVTTTVTARWTVVDAEPMTKPYGSVKFHPREVVVVTVDGALSEVGVIGPRALKDGGEGPGMLARYERWSIYQAPAWVRDLAAVDVVDKADAERIRSGQ